MRQRITCLVLVLVLLASFLAGTNLAADPSVFKGPYFGQTQPGSIPQVFAPEILSRSKPEWAFCGGFSPNQREFYFSSYDTGKGVDQIMWMRRDDDTWTQSAPVSFNSAEGSNDSRLSPDGNTLFFRSHRPLPGNDLPEKDAYGGTD